jgi:hypothetical protein
MKLRVWFFRPDWTDIYSALAGCYLRVRHPNKPLFTHALLTLHDCKHTWVAEYGAFGFYVEQHDFADISLERAAIYVEFEVTFNTFLKYLCRLYEIKNHLKDRRLRLIDFATNQPTCTYIPSVLFGVQDSGRWLTPVRLAEELIDLGGEPYEAP